MSANSQRRRSGVFEPEPKPTNGRPRWTQRREKKEPSMYDSWIAQGKNKAKETTTSDTPDTTASRPMPVARGTTAAGSTIRTVPPEPEALGMRQDSSPPERNLDRATASHAASSSVGSPATPTTTTTTTTTTKRTTTSPSGSSKSRRLIKERAWDRLAHHSPPGSKNGHGHGHGSGSGSSNSGPSSFLSRRGSGSKRRARQDPDVMSNNATTSSSQQRPRTRTLDDRRGPSPAPPPSDGRLRMGSLRATSPPKYPDGVEYLASVPAHMQPPPAPSISSYTTHRPDSAGRAISPNSSGTADSTTSVLPNARTKRIVHLMKTLHGKMGGQIKFRRRHSGPWCQCYGYIHEETGSLMYESQDEGVDVAMVQDLRSWAVACLAEGDTPYLELKSRVSAEEIHLRLLTQPDFDAWFAALLHWQPADAGTASSNGTRSESEMSGNLAPLAEKTEWSRSRSPRDSAGNAKGDRRASLATPTATQKENPVIKIGKMIYWDMTAGYAESGVAASLGQPATVRPQVLRTQSVSSRRWRRISGQLRENGELKLHSDTDNSLITVIQLSQLSRCAIQRLDPSVLDNDFSIAVYPQYTATYTSNPQGLNRPLFLSLETRVLHEVWYVLLRAFTMPSIYGPRMDFPESGEHGELERSHELESMIATRPTYTFRMERSLHVRVVEARMLPSSAPAESAHCGPQSRGQTAILHPEKFGYYADVLLDNETRGKTVVKNGSMNPLWGETFDFQDLPPVLSAASVIIKRRPLEAQASGHQNEGRIANDAYSLAGDPQGGLTTFSFDVTCGRVEIHLDELEPDKDVERWRPLLDMYGQKVGEVLIKVRAEEGIILMARDYQPLTQLLHRFTNGLTSQIAEMIPQELKRLSDCLLNIFQVSGKAGEWLMSLVEEEIDGIDKDTPITRLRYTRRVGSNDSSGQLGHANGDRELIVRDMNKSANNEANVLFRGNTLLTKSLDTHMRRVGKEYLEASLANIIRIINEKDPDCEVDPIRVNSAGDLERNRRRLLIFTQEVWKAIVAAKSRCPIELRIVFRHVRACAEDRFGDFARNVSFTSVSGFLFLRFLCPAILNPKLFGLLKDDIKPRARRTFTLIAKTVQSLANMVPAGSKESWMECMNPFLVQHRESFKYFIDDICYVPTALTSLVSPSSPSSPTYPPGLVSAEQHLSYTTPMTIMQRLPPSSREGFPSLPYLIDQARAFADLIRLWLEATAALSNAADSSSLPGKTRADILGAINASSGEFKTFHQLCEALSHRTQECLTRAERAERPESATSFQWEDIIDQLHRSDIQDGRPQAHGNHNLQLNRIASDSTMLASGDPEDRTSLAQMGNQDADTDDEQHVTRLYDPTPPRSRSPTAYSEARRSSFDAYERPAFNSVPNNLGGGGGVGRPWAHYPRVGDRAASPVPSTSAASLSNASSVISSDTEHSGGTTTALPSYEREVRHRERREQARRQIQEQVEASRVREREKKEEKELLKEQQQQRKKVSKLSSALRKKKQPQPPLDVTTPTTTTTTTPTTHQHHHHHQQARDDGGPSSSSSLATARAAMESSSSLAVNHGMLG